jgi:hypothetical protein
MAFNPPLQVVGYVATRKGDPERGPLVRLRSDEAAIRAVVEGEFVWVYGPRRHDLAPVVIDDSVPRGGVVVRDLAGVTLTEIVRLVKATADRPVLPPSLA